MKRIVFAVLGIMIIMGFSALAGKVDDEKAGGREDTASKISKVQTICPVMEGKINRELYVDIQGKRIYVCCQACIDKVKKDPETYIKKLEGEGVKIEEVVEKPSK